MQATTAAVVATGIPSRVAHGGPKANRSEMIVQRINTTVAARRSAELPARRLGDEPAGSGEVTSSPYCRGMSGLGISHRYSLVSSASPFSSGPGPGTRQARSRSRPATASPIPATTAIAERMTRSRGASASILVTNISAYPR
jgi:hypothetical protein